MVTTGGARHQFRIAVRGAGQPDLDIGLGDTAGAMAKLLHHQFGGIGIQRLRDGGHDAEFHQRLDYIAGAGGHAVGQFLHGDRVGQNDVTHHFHLI